MSATLTPRANETAAVHAILESGEYDDAESMAKALVRAVGTELSRRDAFLVVIPDGMFVYGPYWTAGQAQKAWEQQIGSSFAGRGRIAHSFSWEGRKDETTV